MKRRKSKISWKSQLLNLFFFQIAFLCYLSYVLMMADFFFCIFDWLRCALVISTSIILFFSWYLPRQIEKSSFVFQIHGATSWDGLLSCKIQLKKITFSWFYFAHVIRVQLKYLCWCHPHYFCCCEFVLSIPLFPGSLMMKVVALLSLVPLLSLVEPEFL